MRSLSKLFLAAALLSCALIASPVFAAPKAPAVVKQAPVPEKPATIVDALSADKNLHDFLDLVKDAKLEDVLRSKTDTYTVFAPTNAALDALPSAIKKKIKADKGALQTFVKHHIISGSLVFSENIRGRRASPSMLSGEMSSFDGISSPDQKVNDSKIVKKDLVTNNGIVQVIDAALIPPSFSQPAVAPTPTPTPSPTNTPKTAPTAEAPKAEAAPAAPPETKPWWKRLFSK